MSTHILVVDDERSWSTLVKQILQREGHDVVVAADGDSAIQHAKLTPPDLVILDVNLKGLSGFDVCKWLRAHPPTATVPILMLTVMKAEQEKVRGLLEGADDYLTKPFGHAELSARVAALLRRARTGGAPEQALRAGALCLNLDRHEVTVKGQLVALRPKEFDLLALLMQKKGRVLTKEFLTRSIWGEEAIVTDATLAQHMKNLRAKLGSSADAIETIETLGYKFRDA